MGKRREEHVAISNVANKKAKVSDAKENEVKGKILKIMMEFHIDKRFNIKVVDVANELGVHPRSKNFQKSWVFLKNEKHFIGPGNGGGLQLTREGLNEVKSPEYKDLMRGVSLKPKTNKEHHKRMKKFFKKPKCGIIFDKLLEYKSLTKQQLSDLVGLSIRSKGFAESLSELRKKGYVTNGRNSKAFVLSEKCFLRGRGNGEDDGDIDQTKLAEEIAAGRVIIEGRRKCGQLASTCTDKKVKKKIGVKVENMEVNDEIAVKQENIY